MRQTIAALRALFPTGFGPLSACLMAVCLIAAPAFAPSALAQTRDQIRQQNEQLYQQYQSAPGDQSPTGQGGQGLAPPISGAGDDAAYQPPPESSGRSGGGGGLLPQLLDRVNRLEEQNRDLSGRVDELERQLAQTSAQLNKQIGDLSFAVQQGGHGVGGPGASGVSAAPGAVPDQADPPAVVAPRTPEASLRAGNKALARRDYAGASDSARAALATGHGVHASNAEYMLAQSYAGQGNYQQAAVAYYDAYNRQPRGPLAQDALLHVGSSMIALGQSGAACEALSKLRAEFPKAKPAVARAAATLRAKARC